ncbi:MAG: PTS sugar transporter subunit IIA [candidate division WOR-3 bacterium]|nr:PTS sugar transporter subunit IIA [candidate division WOR-3 bacterium]MCX7947511.1 PTS sugar transporter subunit IIA [candidate division WOR-3 bacterium]MDW8150397.1 PTS sugar transporter subunit IIA [candidate division WOR-3 bacterium]
MLEKLLSEERIKIGMEARTKEEALKELVELLNLSDESKQIILDALKKREVIGSTGIGRGIAIPHTRSTIVNEVYLIIGVSRDGVDFQSIDNQPVHLFFLLVAPPNDPGTMYLIVLGKIAQIAKRIAKENIDYLSIKDKKELIQLILSLEA